MNEEDIIFNRDRVLENINTFYHYGMCWDDNYNKIEIIEEALNKTHRKLIDALRDRSTHCHKRNMIFTFQRLIELYELSFIHDSDYYNKCLADICLNRFQENKELIEAISKIITHDDLTHRDQNILLRPYLFDFENHCFISSWCQYKQLRKRLKEKLNSLILEWIAEENELKSYIRERVLNDIISEVEQ